MDFSELSVLYQQLESAQGAMEAAMVELNRLEPLQSVAQAAFFDAKRDRDTILRTLHDAYPVPAYV